MENIKDSIDFLKKSPVFAMSLSSKELFHSNFWAWLFEHNSEYARVFFGDKIVVNDIKADSIKREQKNRDITIWQGDQAFVIENKLKSIPYEEQLVKYKNDLNDKFAGGVVTGIEVPSFDMPKGWTFIPYDEIGRKIKDIAANVEINDILTKEIILEYANVIINIATLLKDRCAKYGEKLMGSTSEEDINSIRMGDILQKLNAEKFVKYLQKYLECDEPVGYKLEIKSGFTNGTALIDIRFETKENTNSNTPNKIGIQIQGKQYRCCIEFKEEKKISNNEATKRYDIGKGMGWFSSETKEKPTTQRNEYCKYLSNDSSFIYQHWAITDYSFESLTTQIADDLKKAKKCIESHALN